MHAECLKLTGEAEPHGSALGLGGIEKIAAILRDFFAEHDCPFFFTRIEKIHLVATKIFDLLMDSGINKAVTNLHYAIRGAWLRIYTLPRVSVWQRSGSPGQAVPCTT